MSSEYRQHMSGSSLERNDDSIRLKISLINFILCIFLSYVGGRVFQHLGTLGKSSLVDMLIANS